MWYLATEGCQHSIQILTINAANCVTISLQKLLHQNIQELCKLCKAHAKLTASGDSAVYRAAYLTLLLFRCLETWPTWAHGTHSCQSPTA